MICQNCNANVADDLVFCTECGARLHETLSHTPTVLMNDSVVTKISASKTQKSSKSKWIALIAGLVFLLLAVPVGIFVAYKLSLSAKPAQTAANNEKPAAKTPAANKPKTNSNAAETNQTVAITNANLNANDSNSEPSFTDDNSDADETEIWNDKIEIAPGEHYAIPFKLAGNTRLLGNVKLLRGDAIEGYVYLQSQYDEHFPDPTYKMFVFEGEKTAKVDARLVGQNYVLIFVNKSATPLIVEGKFTAVTQKD